MSKKISHERTEKDLVRAALNYQKAESNWLDTQSSERYTPAIRLLADAFHEGSLSARDKHPRERLDIISGIVLAQLEVLGHRDPRKSSELDIGKASIRIDPEDMPAYMQYKSAKKAYELVVKSLAEGSVEFAVLEEMFAHHPKIAGSTIRKANLWHPKYLE